MFTLKKVVSGHWSRSLDMVVFAAAMFSFGKIEDWKKFL